MKKEETSEDQQTSQKKIVVNLKKISEIAINPSNVKKQAASTNQKVFPSLTLNQTHTFMQSIDFPKSSFEEKFRKTNLSTRILKNLCKMFIVMKKKINHFSHSKR